MKNLKVNQTSPNFEIEDFNGNKFSLSDFEGMSNVLIVMNRGFV